MIGQDHIYREIKSKLHDLRQRRKKLRLWSGCLLYLAGLLVMCFFLVGLESIFHFSAVVRIILIFAGVFLGGTFLILWIGNPVFSLLFQKDKPDDDYLALQAGESFTHVRDRLTDALQVYRAHQKPDYNTSASLASAALSAIHNDIKSMDFKSVPPRDRIRRSVRFLITVCSVVVVSTLFFREPFASALTRWIHPTQSFSGPPPFQLFLHPGNKRVIQGEDVNISVEVRGKMLSEVILRIQSEGEEVHSRSLEKPFTFRMNSVRKSFKYSAQSEGIKSPVCMVEVVQRPLVRMIQVELVPPGYTKLEKRALEPNIGDLEGLKGTQVRLSVESNKELSDAHIVFAEGNKQRMNSRGKKAGAEFPIHEESRYWIELRDTMGLENSDPISYRIRIQPDLFPVARILFPATHVDLDETMDVPLSLLGEDDFGISRCQLGYSIQTGETPDSLDRELSFIPLSFDKNNMQRVNIQFVWNLDSLGLYPEDVVHYFFQVFDNDRISGPKSGRSRIYTIRFPSIYEIFQEVESEHVQQVESLTDLFNEGQEIREELERISDEIKGGRELEWEEKKNLESVADQQKGIEQKVEELSRDLDEMVDRMEKYDLLNLELLEKYQELQELYQEIASPELLEAMKKLQEEMAAMSQEDLRKVADQFKLSQEKFLKSLERTISLLKRLHVEQKTQEIVKRMEDLVERQGDVNQALNQDTPLDTSKWVQSENRISEDMESLQQEMESLLEAMEDLPSMPLSQMESIMESMDRRELSEQLKKLGNMIQRGQRSQAASEGSKTQQSMSDLLEMLQRMQEDLKRNLKEKITRGLQRATFRLLQLSDGQEGLKTGAQSGKITSKEAAEKQMSLLMGLKQVADSLAQLSKETLFITPEVGGAIGTAQSEMGKALKSMTEGGGRGTVSHQGNAVGSLNQGVLAIQDIMGQIAGASSGLGMEEFLMRMDQMAQQQMGLNQQTMDLLNRGRMTLGEQAGMARLANEQALLKKALEDVRSEFNDQSQIPGRLDQMIEDMDGVIKDLQQKKADQSTIQRQQRILSRLLDLQNSLRRRDFSRKRRGRTGQDIIRSSPQPQAAEEGWREAMRQDILRLAREGYVKEYQDLIRAYFEALTRDNAAQLKNN
ncbi:DUF4175 family protein [bacterium]